MEALLKKIASLNILVVGDVMLDHYIWGETERVSPEAPTPVIDVVRDSYMAGGAANVALNVASLGAKATVAGFFGRDDAGKRLSGIITQKGIATIPTPGSGSTIVKTRLIVRRQQVCRFDRESPLHSYQIEPVHIESTFAKFFSRIDAVIFSDYAKGLLNDELITRLIALARENKVLVAIDPKPRRKLKFFQPDLLTPNRRESLQLAGLEAEPGQPFPAAEVCARIYEIYRPRNLVITLSEEGMLLSHRGKVGQVIPTVAREVFDVSGAGDTAIAALTLGLAGGAMLEEAAQLANVAAGVVVGKLGTATATPEEILAQVNAEE
ncbi:MAG TPA: bifunctional ADP-heptose synthase [Candidatus Didemnitutus sp.]|nr:bifunctional ADP-heptose synthase [Candidatus Didemnitutus sp.]